MMNGDHPQAFFRQGGIGLAFRLIEVSHGMCAMTLPGAKFGSLANLADKVCDEEPSNI